MARRKNYYSFLDFNYVDGAVDLFHNTIRGAFEYDALTDDIFEAVVLTEPTPIVGNATHLRGRLAAMSSDKNQKLSFRVRILGPNSPHRFLEDPCLIEDASDDVTADTIFSIIQNHTQVVIYDISKDRVPKTGDIVNIRLSRTGNSFDIRRAKQYIGIVSDADGVRVKGTDRPDCVNLSNLFDDVDFNSMGSPLVNEDAMRALVQTFKNNSLPVIQELMEAAYPSITFTPIKITSDIRTTADGRKMIYREAVKRNIETSIKTESEAVNSPEEIDRLIPLLKNSGFIVAKPEQSNHNPAKEGKIAMDLQAAGSGMPSYSAINEAVSRYKSDPRYVPDTLGFEIVNFVLEKNNGSAQCPAESGTKCGVYHLEVKPLNSSAQAIAPPPEATSGDKGDVQEGTEEAAIG